VGVVVLDELELLVVLEDADEPPLAGALNTPAAIPNRDSASESVGPEIRSMV
jgi:hypothetical protein